MSGMPAIGSDGDSINLRELIGRLWRGKWWIAGAATLLALGSGIAASLIAPVYRASTVVVPAAPGGIEAAGGRSSLGSLAGIASMVGIGTGATSDSTQEALAVLRSREFIYRFIEKRSLLPILFPDSWNTQTESWIRPEEAPTLEMGYKVFFGRVMAIAEDTRTGLVTLTVDWHDRNLAASWANELVSELNEHMRARALQQAEASLNYLEEESKLTTQVGTQEAISRLIEAQINKRMLANVTMEFAFRVADRAMPPGEKDVVKPRRNLLVVAGFALGTVLGALGVLLFSVVDNRR